MMNMIAHSIFSYIIGTPGWIRTYNHMILNQAALPISVQGHYLKNFAESTFSTA